LLQFKNAVSEVSNQISEIYANIREGKEQEANNAEALIMLIKSNEENKSKLIVKGSSKLNKLMKKTSSIMSSGNSLISILAEN
jgi:hypothetical protein